MHRHWQSNLGLKSYLCYLMSSNHRELGLTHCQVPRNQTSRSTEMRQQDQTREEGHRSCQASGLGPPPWVPHHQCSSP